MSEKYLFIDNCIVNKAKLDFIKEKRKWKSDILLMWRQLFYFKNKFYNLCNLFIIIVFFVLFSMPFIFFVWQFRANLFINLFFTCLTYCYFYTSLLTPKNTKTCCVLHVWHTSLVTPKMQKKLIFYMFGTHPW